MRWPCRIGAVLFDLDGVLLDTERLYRDAFVEAAVDFGWRVDPEFYRTLIGIATPERREAIAGAAGLDFPIDDFLGAYRARKHAALDCGAAPKPGVLPLLDLLDKRGIPVGVATSCGRRTAAANLDRSGFAHRFEVLVTREDVGAGKPNPGCFLAAASRLAWAPDLCVVIEDSHPGVLAAARANMATILVPDLVPPSPEIAAHCAAIARDLHAVHGLLSARLPSP